MTTIRFEITDSAGAVVISDGMMSAPESTSADLDARSILSDLGQDGWGIRLWKGMDLVGTLESLGEPDVKLVSQ